MGKVEEELGEPEGIGNSKAWLTCTVLPGVKEKQVLLKTLELIAETKSNEIIVEQMLVVVIS